MKKRFLAVAVILATLGLIFVGCGIRESDLVGTWEGTSGTFIGQAFQFDDSGTGKHWMIATEALGAKSDISWSIKGKTLTVSGFGDNDVEVKDSTMKWTKSGTTIAEFKKR